MIKLNNWSVTTHPSDAFRAPEVCAPCLAGETTGHHRFADGKSIITSHIVKSLGRVVTTESGSVYDLGDVSPEYREWLNKNRPNWDENNPITTIKE